MKSVAWNGIHFALPDDWELLQFSKNPEKGRLVFGDRYQFRFEIDWMSIDSQPDLERMISDYKAKLTTDGIKEAKVINRHPWHGVTGLENGALISRYCNFFNNRTLLVEAVFLWPEQQTQKHSQQFEGRILDDITVVPFQEDGQQLWNAFGIRCTAPEVHCLEQCKVEPANVKFFFTDEKRRELETVSRIGMLKTWLKGGVDEWLKSIVPEKFVITELHHTTKDNHEIWTMEATVKRAVLKDWWLGRRMFYAAAWICPEDKRLFAVTKQTHKFKDGHPHLPIALSCCNNMEITL